MFEGLRKPKTLIVIVVTLLAYGCPVQAIVQAFGLDERTVASWRDRAGKQCQQVHQAVVQQGQLDLVHVQADEIRVKGCNMIAWMGLVMMVSTLCWLLWTSVRNNRRPVPILSISPLALPSQRDACAKKIENGQASAQ